MAKYYLTERAAIHLRQIYNYTVERWGEKQAGIYMQKIVKHFQTLAAKPEIGRSRKDNPAQYFMAEIEKHHAIYRKFRGGIIVAAVLHTKRDIEGIMNQIGSALAFEISIIEENIEEK